MKGFTLIEMLLTLMLAMMLSTACILGLQYWQMHTEALVQVSQIKQDIAHAQSLARYYHQNINLCGSSDGRHCDGDWGQGRLFIKKNGHESNILLFHHLKLLYGIWQWRSALGQNDRLIFHALGDNLGQQGSFYYCSKSHLITFMQRVVINQLGRVYSRQGQYSTVCGGKETA